MKITSFDSASGLYGVYFACDGETVYINLSQEADDNILQVYKHVETCH